MARSRLKSALLVSLLLHAGAVILILLQRPASESTVQPPKATEWVIVDVVPAPPPPAPKVVKAPPIKKAAPKEKQAKAEAVEPVAVPLPPEPVALDEPRSTAPVPSKPINLFPLPSLLPSTEVAEAPHGHTSRPDDPEFRPEVIRAEEEHRVKQRVDGWAQDELAEVRAQGGLPHPYFSGVRDAARAGLDKRAREAGITATTGQMMKEIGKRYADSASSYAKTGDPNLGPPGVNPRQSEVLKERMGNMPEAMALRALVQATETQNELSHGKPLIALTLELRQFRDGRPLTAMVIQASSDARFDAFVLDAWPKSIAEAGPPPADAFHGPELRSIWAVEGWLGLPKKLEAAISYLPMPGIMGMGADKLLPALTEEGYHYEFHARLLRVYQ